MRRELRQVVPYGSILSVVIMGGVVACMFFVGIASAAVMSPVITSIVRDGEDSNYVVITGKAEPNAVVSVEIGSTDKGQLFHGEAPADDDGRWEIAVPDSSFPTGDYVLRTVSHSSDGNVSAPREVRGHKLQQPPALAVGGFGIGWFDILIVVIFMALFVAALAAYWYERSLRRRDIERVKHDQNMHALCTTLCDEVNVLSPLTNSIPQNPQALADIHFRIGKLQGTLEKMQQQLASELQQLR